VILLPLFFVLLVYTHVSLVVIIYTGKVTGTIKLPSGSGLLHQVSCPHEPNDLWHCARSNSIALLGRWIATGLPDLGHF
jgi:hypothetical protein